MTEQKKHSDILGKVGKNPEQDWMLVLIICVTLVISVLVFLGLDFFKTQAFIKSGITSTDATGGVNVKTKEEELRDIIDVYVKKKQAHEALLGRSKFEVEKAPATTTASTTASTVASSTNAIATSSIKTASSTRN